MQCNQTYRMLHSSKTELLWKAAPCKRASGRERIGVRVSKLFSSISIAQCAAASATAQSAFPLTHLCCTSSTCSSSIDCASSRQQHAPHCTARFCALAALSVAGCGCCCQLVRLGACRLPLSACRPRQLPPSPAAVLTGRCCLCGIRVAGGARPVDGTQAATRRD